MSPTFLNEANLRVNVSFLNGLYDELTREEMHEEASVVFALMQVPSTIEEAIEYMDKHMKGVS